MLRDSRGSTLIEVVVAVAILAIITIPITSALTGGLRSQASAAFNFEVQETAQEGFSRILDGETRGGDKVGGLRNAIQACTEGDNTSCSGGIAFLLPPLETNQVVSYRQEGSRLIRTVCYLDQTGCALNVPKEGGTPVMENVTRFQVNRDQANPRVIKLIIEVKKEAPVTGPAGVILETSVMLVNSY